MSSAPSSPADGLHTEPVASHGERRAGQDSGPDRGSRHVAPTVAVLIPAYDEQDTIGTVVATALASEVGTVVVIDDGSRDATSVTAKAAGADVVRLPVNRGKGGALWAGAHHVDSEVVVLLDADLVGLRPEHVTALAAPVLNGRADMTRGTFKGGRLSTSLAQRATPQLNGQRALRREALLDVPGLAESRYGVEVAITKHARAEGWRLVEVPMWGVTQVMKEEKRGLLAGIGVRLRMYGDILVELLRGTRR